VSALYRTCVRTALRAMQARHARVHSAPHMHAKSLGALRAMQARHARVRPAPHIRAKSASRYHDAGETRTCPPCTAHTCEQRCALCRRDTHVSALICTYVRRELRAIMMQARHARVRPALHIRANSALRYAGETLTCPPCTAHTCRESFAICGRDTQVSALHRTFVVQRALRATRARHECVRSAPHIRANSALRYAGETCTCPPCTARSAHACRERFALSCCRRDTHVSALHRTCVRTALRAMQARHARDSSATHMRAKSASRYYDAGETRT
jgi:hypothetical protein